MTANLSFAGRPSDGIAHFYTTLHKAMYGGGRVDNASFPSAKEFKGFLAGAYPKGLNGLRCLDAGCGGTAINSRTLAAAGAERVLAVDLNYDSLQLVRRSLPPNDSGLRLTCASLLQLPFPDATFDFVICSGVVHHTPEPEHTLRELRRIVKPHGRLWISAYCFEGSVMFAVVKLWRLAARVVPFPVMQRMLGWNAVGNNFVLDHMYVPILWVYRAPDFSAMLERAGLIVEDTFVSALDRLHGRRIGSWSITGDGLLRIFLCRPGVAGAGAWQSR